MRTGTDTRIVKDPEAAQWPKGIDWTKQLAEWGEGEIIATSTWDIENLEDGDDDDLEEVASSIVTGALKTQLRLSGGTPGSTYVVTNHITTSSGIQDDRSFTVLIKDR